MDSSSSLVLSGRNSTIMKRRKFLSTLTGATAAAVAATQTRALAQAQAAQAASSGGAVVIDPKPLFDISPHLYMQFMEPLEVTDSSVEAAWDYEIDDWRKDFVETTKDLAPGMMRFGGLLSRYYKWREGIGPAAKRPLYRNYVWGGWETHRVGTHEFVDTADASPPDLRPRAICSSGSTGRSEEHTSE